MTTKKIGGVALCLLLLLLAAPVSAQDAKDAFDLNAAVIVNAPDVRSWAPSAQITVVSFDGAVSRLDFTKKDGPSRWPDVTPPGFAGPVEWTWWLFRQINGTWYGSAFLLMWNGRDGTGSPTDPDVPSVYHAHWFYAPRWNPLMQAGPIQAGEVIGMMATAGAARDNTGPYAVRERTNVVTFPATDRGVMPFAASAPPPTLPPPVVVPPVPVTPLPATDLSPLLNILATNHALEMAEFAEVKAEVAAVKQDLDDFHAEVRSKWVSVMDSPIVKYGLAAISGWLLKLAVKP